MSDLRTQIRTNYDYHGSEMRERLEKVWRYAGDADKQAVRIEFLAGSDLAESARQLAAAAAEAAKAAAAKTVGLDARLGRDHDISLVIALNLASDLAELGEIGAARTLGEDTLRRVKKVLGATHPLTLAAAANLSLDLRADGASEAAMELSAETQRGYEQTLSLNHPDALVAAEQAAGLRLRSPAAMTGSRRPSD